MNQRETIALLKETKKRICKFDEKRAAITRDFNAEADNLAEELKPLIGGGLDIKNAIHDGSTTWLFHRIDDRMCELKVEIYNLENP